MTDIPEKFFSLTKIDRNAEKCLLCGDVVESVHRHDYNVCSCGNVMRDGGKDYIRANITKPGTSEHLTEWHYYTMEETEELLIHHKEQLAKPFVLSKNYYEDRMVLLEEYKQFLLESENAS